MKLVRNIFSFIILSFLLISCGSEQQDSKLIVATAADNPPYEFIQNSEIVGFDIDLINAIGEKLGKKVVIKNFDFNGLMAALTSKNVDMIIAGLGKTEERQKYVSFSIPYLTEKDTSSISVLYRLSDNFKEISDLNGKTVGAQLGTVWATILQEAAKLHNIKIHHLSNNLILVEELKSKSIDAVVLEELQCKKFIENNPELSSFNLEGHASEFAIALNKDSDLIEQVNKAITELREEGFIKKISKKWLGK
ncbi:MAG: ABC transporter substrate-binding protein [Rickettsia endosymbiont of Bryobia graminum]|nr:ABC transporter substrate-binding protein [Rickettsia endosymbiont of Bryobia graminum]